MRMRLSISYRRRFLMEKNKFIISSRFTKMKKALFTIPKYSKSQYNTFVNIKNLIFLLFNLFIKVHLKKDPFSRNIESHYKKLQNNVISCNYWCTIFLIYCELMRLPYMNLRKLCLNALVKVSPKIK